MEIKPLSENERKWSKRFDSCLKAMPKRLLIVECADGVYIVDRAASIHTDMSDGGAERAGIILCDVPNGTLKIQSVSG